MGFFDPLRHPWRFKFTAVIVLMAMNTMRMMDFCCLKVFAAFYVRESRVLVRHIYVESQLESDRDQAYEVGALGVSLQ